MPFAVTVDYETVEKDTVTLRERDSRAQVNRWSCDEPAVDMWPGHSRVVS